MGDIKIDGKLFQERINHFVNAWKADKRAGDVVFSGVSSILIMMGKVEENPEFQKNNAMHVRFEPILIIIAIYSRLENLGNLGAEENTNICF